MSGLFHDWRHPRRCYVVCAVARSGSNLLTDGLTATRCAGRPNQYFWPKFEDFFREKQQLPAGIAFADYVRAIIKQTATSNEVFGFKLMPWYVNDFIVRLRQTGVFGEESASDLEVLRNAFPRLRFIQIVRRNKLRQAISKARAMQTGLWKVMPGKTEAAAPQFNREQIEHCLKDTEDGEKLWRAFFQRIGVEPFPVEYEELCRNYVGTIRAVLAFLKIKLPRRIEIADPVTVRQSDALSDEWEQRYRAAG